MKRRHFLQQAALAGATGIVSAGLHGWTWKNPAQATSNSPDNPPRLIVIFLRGAADGLNIVVPYQEANYYEARPTIAIARPGHPKGALDLNGQFGLHPALQALMPQWQRQNLAFVPACGSPVLSRSHFEAQDNLESGTPGSTRAADGWLNRLLAFLPNNTPTQAVGMGSNASLILQGPQSVANLAITGAGLRPLPIDRPQIQTHFDQLYAQDPRLGPIYHEGRMARDVLLREINASADTNAMEASRGAPAPGRFANSARYLAQLMAGDSSTQVAFIELGEWDTHVNERSILNRNLGLLGDGLAVLTEQLGDAYQNTAIVVMSEFGRTIAENGNGGTDHGFGNTLWLMGGAIKGQQLYGEWPGLAPAQQHQSRDLAITTDFRDVLSSLLGQQFSLAPSELAQIFPEYEPQQSFQLVG